MENEGVIITQSGKIYTRQIVDEKGNRRKPRFWKYMIPGRPITGKNSQQRTKYGIIPSKAYLAYSSSAMAYLEPQTEKPIDFPVNLSLEYYMPTIGDVDLANLINGTQDILVKAGILLDDRRDIVYSLDGCRVYYDKERPRVEITVMEVPYAIMFHDCVVKKVKPKVKPKSVKRSRKKVEQDPFEALSENQNLPF